MRRDNGEALLSSPIKVVLLKDVFNSTTRGGTIPQVNQGENIAKIIVTYTYAVWNVPVLCAIFVIEYRRILIF